MAPESTLPKPSWRTRLTLALRSKPSSTPTSISTPQRLRKHPISPSHLSNQKGSPSASSKSIRKIDSKLTTPTPSRSDNSTLVLSSQTGERKDHTELLHSLTHTGDFDSEDEGSGLIVVTGNEIPGEERIASLPDSVWERIISHLSLVDAANLTLTSKTLREFVGNEVWNELDKPSNRPAKLEFLNFMDSQLPNHLLCFPCTVYHRRLNPGSERLKASHIINPLFSCPYANTPGVPPPRLRLTPGYSLPFPLLQLALRSHHFSPSHGIPMEALARRYTDSPPSKWSHRTSYLISKSHHLLFRCTSQAFALPSLPPSGLRHLLYTRTDYTPYFSVCAHWRDGVLMDVCKCALSHIPQPQASITRQLAKKPQISLATRHQKYIVTLCNFCRPLRRCVDCATEYLVEVKVVEDPNSASGGNGERFKHAIVVTRWSDLGDGRTSPWEGEWGACNGTAEERYDSFGKVGKRAISGVFESQYGVAMPGQKMLSLNPRKERRGEEGGGWY